MHKPHAKWSGSFGMVGGFDFYRLRRVKSTITPKNASRVTRAGRIPAAGSNLNQKQKKLLIQFLIFKFLKRTFQTN